ncbi:MAG: hypothetical protein ACT4OM_07465 [Actinomycetota bacterium]
MRWTNPKTLKITGFVLIGLAPFVVAYLLLPEGDQEAALSTAAAPPGPSVDVPLDFPFSSPSDFPINDVPVIAASPSSTPPASQCSNRRDDDGDGKVDAADPGCSSRSDNSEAPDPSPAASPTPSPSPEASPEPVTINCDDGLDNDGDGLPDGADPGCADDGNELPFNFSDGRNDPGACDEIEVPGCRPSGTTTTTVTTPPQPPTASPDPTTTTTT